MRKNLINVKNGPWMLFFVIPLLKYLQIDIKKRNSIVIKNQKNCFDKSSFFFLISQKKFFLR